MKAKNITLIGFAAILLMAAMMLLFAEPLDSLIDKKYVTVFLVTKAAGVVLAGLSALIWKHTKT